MRNEELEIYLETHFEITTRIAEHLIHWNQLSPVVTLYQIHGRAKMYKLAKELTDKFEKLYEGVVWGEDLDWIDTIEEFLEKELK